MHFYFFIIIIIKEKKRGQIMEKIYKYFKEINKLNTIVRTGWLNRAVPLERLESVGEHIFTMSLLALSTIDKYKLDLNIEKVLKMILIHELGEIDIGDIALPTGNQIKEKYEGELKGVKRICSVIDESWMLDLWLEFEEKKSPEASFVYKMDKLQAVMQSRYYSELTNNPALFDEFYENAIPKCGEFLEISKK